MKHSISILSLIAVLVALFALPKTVQATESSPTPAPVVITVIVLDKDGNPLADQTVTLTLVRYSTSVEYLPPVSCTTDDKGHCVFDIADAPRMNGGRAEALLKVGSYPEKIIGWTGSQADITVSMSDLGLLATVAAGGPLDSPYEGQTQQPTDAPIASNTPLPTTAIPTATQTPHPPTETLLPTVTATITPVLPTVTPLIPTATPLPTATSMPLSPHLDTGQALLIGVVGIVVLVLAVGLVLGYIQWRKARWLGKKAGGQTK